MAATRPRSAPAAKARPARGAAPRASAGEPAVGLAILDRAASGDFPPSLYLEGPDEALKAAFLAEFRRSWAAAVPEAPAARVLHPGEDEVDDILNAYHGISMFTPRELILVLVAEKLVKSEKRIAALAAGLARPAGASCIVIVESAAEAPRKSLEPVRAACAVNWSAEPLDSRGLLVWGRRRLAACGLEAEPGALEALLAACENESVSFLSELGKLEGWSSGTGRVSKADVAALSRPVVGAGLEDYLAAVATGEGALAVKRLGRILAAGENEGGVMFALGNIVGGALGGWTRWKPVAAVLARRRSARELAVALDAVYRAEAAWKGGRADVLLVLEQATREVAGS